MEDDEDTGPFGDAEFEIKQYDHASGPSTYVRRIAVPSGWLYQTLDGSPTADPWSQPVFVARPSPSNPSELIAEMLTSS